MTCATLYKLILWSNDTLNAQKWQFCAKLNFKKLSKMAIFALKFIENGFEKLWKRKNRHLLTFGSIEIVSRIVWSHRLILRIPWVPTKSPKAIRDIRRRAKVFSRTLSSNMTFSWKHVLMPNMRFLEKFLRKHEKSTTHRRLRPPKLFETSYDHAKHFVG